MLEWVVIGALALGGGGYAAGVVRRGRAHGRWRRLLEEVAPRVGARTSPGSMFDAPELRAEIEGLTVTLRLVDVHKGRRGRVEAQASLPDAANTVRLYLGWDVVEPPPGLEHVPEVPFPSTTRVEGTVTARADDAALASRVLERGILDLTDIRREAQARALELVSRGGHLTLILHGLEPTAAMLERSLRATARLAHLVDAASKGTTLPAEAPAPAAAPPPDACALCERGDKPNEGWVRCAACGAPYHAGCFQQATACLEPGCGSTRALPVG